MKRTFSTLLLITVFSVATVSQNVKPSVLDEKLIRDLMQTQEDAWNDGNIETFMTTYWKSRELVFVSSRGITLGWEATLDRYKKTYPDSAAMGKLNFEILKINHIEKNVAFLVGRYNLTRNTGNASGMFTLVLKKIKGQWLIISDHSG